MCKIFAIGERKMPVKNTDSNVDLTLHSIKIKSYSN